ncbi:MAG TPA: AAA domain-containing protein [Aestuariivirgaceae bacterium]
MTVRDLIETWALHLEAERHRIADEGLDAPVSGVNGRRLRTVGELHVYEFILPSGIAFPVDLPLSIVPSDDNEPTEGLVLNQSGRTVITQVVDALGATVPSLTLVPDHAGLLDTSVRRLREMITKSDAYHLGPSERLASLLTAPEEAGPSTAASSSVLTAIWQDDALLRQQKLATVAIELIRANKRILMLSPDHNAADELAGVVARSMKAGGLTYKTWISRYELALAAQAAGIGLHELGFEAQMHQFYAKARANKASLRKKYERFRELTPLLAYKRQKQKDLDEVRLLEWRLLTHLSELQAKIKEVASTLGEYEGLPLLRRLSMQAVGKNVDSLRQYQTYYTAQIADLTKELDIAKARIDELVPEAAVPKDMRPEFEELKENIVKLGGTKKIRELLAAEEDTNRQAFIQNRRLVVATPTRVASDPLFGRVRFDALIVDDAPRIAAASLLAAAGLVRERIILSGNQRDIVSAGCWLLPRSAEGAIR